mgnify:CR=1 FL=1
MGRGVRNGVMVKAHEISVQFPAPAVTAELAVVCHSSQPAPCETGFKIPEIHCVFAYPTFSLKIPLFPLPQVVADFGAQQYKARLEYHGSVP